MIVLGALGSLDRVDQNISFDTGLHDASATLIRDGEVVAAVEEERLNRYKHSGKLPIEAIRYCLAAAGVSLDRVDKIVFSALEPTVDQIVGEMYRARLIGSFRLARPYLQHVFEREFGHRVNPATFEFIDHHYAHAASAFLSSGLRESLVVTMDGMGEGLGGSVWLGRDGRLVHRRNYDGRPEATTQSIGHLYAAVTGFLGFKVFDEYKVMGLAPYGDPARFRPLFDEVYALGPAGEFEIHLSRLHVLTRACAPRCAGEPITQVHQDIAAALQEATERLLFHVLDFHRRETGATRLCLAGGVAHNCAANGKILRQGRFDDVFVQPASHDGGLSLGAALHGYHNGRRRPCVMTHAYLGPSCGDEETIARELSLWHACCTDETSAAIAEDTAALIAGGAIVGWVQGRAEFGPRALGNRSIVADPRPPAHKEIINAMIKKREAFRPFAPSVLEEYAHEYFELPPGHTQFPYMVFVVPVREQYRAILGAVTHVDGSARIQTVSRESNPLYWQLIEGFRARTGIPILLNTSFNNNAEPIVTSVRDAVISFLTTDLPILVVGNHIVRKKSFDPVMFERFRISLPSFVNLHPPPPDAMPEAVPAAPRERPFFQQLFTRLYADDRIAACCLGTTHDARRRAISPEMASMLARADGYAPFSELARAFDAGTRARLLTEMLDLWGRRLVQILPGDDGGIAR